MKKTALLFLTLFTLLTCSDDLKFNTPGFSGNKNYAIWKATYSNSVVVDGKLKITAGNNSEHMIVEVSSPNIGTYLLTDTSFSKVNFKDFESINYSTSNLPDPDVSLYPEIGEVKITESTAEYVTGTFRFIAFTTDGLKSVGFNEGDFYRVPIKGGPVTNDTLTCQQATSSLATATTSFAEVIPGDTQYPARCVAYKAALQAAISTCGDATGAYQALIDALGNCN